MCGQATDRPYPLDKTRCRSARPWGRRVRRAVLTYRELDGWANRVARTAGGRGGDGSISLESPRPSLELVVATLGVLKSGALASGRPESRRTSRLDAYNAKVKAVISSSGRTRTPESSRRRCGRDRAGDRSPARSAPISACYVIYTSGSRECQCWSSTIGRFYQPSLDERRGLLDCRGRRPFFKASPGFNPRQGDLLASAGWCAAGRQPPGVSGDLTGFAVP